MHYVTTPSIYFGIKNNIVMPGNRQNVGCYYRPKQSHYASISHVVNIYLNISYKTFYYKFCLFYQTKIKMYNYFSTLILLL